ncbi:MAG: BMC domain-containing protein [Candidatus Marinimicrobia bacterium]|nr:BMC domain-containing protein [Candidatus Neomarinimicrobiota bacterium]
MKTYPAIALIEYSSIATGILAGDAMLKKAPITVIKAGTVHNGKYLVLIGGSVASVEESYAKGLAIDPDNIIDSMILPNVHQQLHDSVLGSRLKCTKESLGIIEASSVSTMIKASDAGVKGADVNIIEIRLADDIGGKSFTIYNGTIEEVQAAVEIAKNAITSSEHWVNETIIPNLHADMKFQIDQTTRFTQVKLGKVSDSEV